MSSKLVFINLIIDGLWSEESFLEKIFDVKSPDTQKLARVNEYLGRFFAEDGDFVVCPEFPSVELEPLQRSFFHLSTVTWVPIPTEMPRVEEFALDICNKIQKNKIDLLFGAGVSHLEIAIVNRLKAKSFLPGTDLDLLKKLNSKDYLIVLGKKLNIKIPKSEIVAGSQIVPSSHIFKSLISSGGSGVYGYSDIEKIKLWTLRRKLESEWNASVWLRQENLEREIDINCFGDTQIEDFNMVRVKYDRTRLSYQHDFDFEVDESIQSELKSTFSKVRRHLIESGYIGPFGFDSIVTTSKEIFGVVDLNVRLNKSHVLKCVTEKFVRKHRFTTFFRMRIINSQWPLFMDFWNFVTKSLDVEKYSNSQVLPVDASFWNVGKSECLFTLTTDHKELKIKVENWVDDFLQKNQRRAIG